MALTDRSIITLSELKAYLFITDSDATKDTFLETIIDLCSGRIEEEIDSAVAPQAEEEIIDGTGTRVITMSSFVDDLVGATDEAKLANLQYRDSSDGSWVNVTDSMDNIHFDGKTIELADTQSTGDSVTLFPGGRKNIRVNYYAGFDPVPAKLKMTAIEMSAMMYKESNVGSGQLGTNSLNMGLGGGSFSTTNKDLEAKWKAIFDEYLESSPNVSVINL